VQHNSGVITASVFAMLLAGVVSGGVVGLLLGSVVTSQIAVAFICAFIGAVLALIIGNAILGRDAQFALPSGVMIWNVIIALWLGALAGHELGVDLRDPPATPLVGALSGVLAAVLIGSFVITIYTLRNRLSVPKS
jgi:hypothetical protein